MRSTPVRPLLGGVAAVLVVVAAAFAVPRLLDSGEPITAALGSQECVARASASVDEIGRQDATWVRFCPLADEGAAQRARHPQGVVTDALAAATAVTLWQTQVDRPQCDDELGAPPPGPQRLFRIEVGFADGTVAEIPGDTGCSTRDLTLFSQLETTLLMDAAGAQAAGTPAPRVTCPERFTTSDTNSDGASAAWLVDATDHPWQSTVPLLPMPAVSVDVCAYAGDASRRELVDQWRVALPESDVIRARATTAYTDGIADCELQPGARSYLVVLADATGTARTLALDPTRCSTLSAAIGTPPADTYLGLASPQLVRLVARSRP